MARTEKIFVTGDDTGAVAVYNNLTDVLAWWISDGHYADIECSGLKVSFIEALGLVSCDDSQADGSMRINGQLWKRRDAIPET